MQTLWLTEQMLRYCSKIINNIGICIRTKQYAREITVMSKFKLLTYTILVTLQNIYKK